MFRQMIFALALLATPVAAQDSVFADYQQMRAEMDMLIRDRNITQLMLRFGARDEMTTEQLRGLDARVKGLYPLDFENVAMLRRTEMAAGFAQELIAYWTDADYLFAYVVYHDTGARVTAINFRFNSDFNTLNTLF